MAESRSTGAGKPEISGLKRAKAAASAGSRCDRHGQCQITRDDLEKCFKMRLLAGRNQLNTKQISEMETGDLNTEAQGSNLPENPRQNAPTIPDGSPTKGDVTGQNPATKTKRQTAQMPMKSTIAAHTAQKSTDGRNIRATGLNSFIASNLGTSEGAL